MQRIDDNPFNPIRPIPAPIIRLTLLPPTFSEAHIIIPDSYILLYIHVTCMISVYSCIPIQVSHSAHLTSTFKHIPHTHQSHLILCGLHQPVLQSHLSQLTADVIANMVKAAINVDKCEYRRMNRTRIASATWLVSVLEFL